MKLFILKLSSLTSFLFGPNILLSIQIANTPSPCVFLDTKQHGKVYFIERNTLDHFYDLVVRVSGFSSRGLGFDSGRQQIFCTVLSLERGPLSLVRTVEEQLERKSSGSGLEDRD
jgi:hypothetical protein